MGEDRGELKKIGSLWLKDGKNGKFMSGTLEMFGIESTVFVFKNDKGENPKRPDYQIFTVANDDPEVPKKINDDDVPF